VTRTLCASGGLVTLHTRRNDESAPPGNDGSVKRFGVSRGAGLALAALWLALLVGGIVLRQLVDWQVRWLYVWDVCITHRSICCSPLCRRGGKLLPPLPQQLRENECASGWRTWGCSSTGNKVHAVLLHSLRLLISAANVPRSCSFWLPHQHENTWHDLFVMACSCSTGGRLSSARGPSSLAAAR